MRSRLYGRSSGTIRSDVIAVSPRAECHSSSSWVSARKDVCRNGIVTGSRGSTIDTAILPAEDLSYGSWCPLCVYMCSCVDHRCEEDPRPSAVDHSTSHFSRERTKGTLHARSKRAVGGRKGATAHASRTIWLGYLCATANVPQEFLPLRQRPILGR